MNSDTFRSLEDIEKSIAAVVAPNAQLTITNGLLLNIRQLLIDQADAQLQAFCLVIGQG